MPEAGLSHSIHVSEEVAPYADFEGKVGRVFATSEPWWPPEAGVQGKPNVPLAQSDNENARALVTLDELTVRQELTERGTIAASFRLRIPLRAHTSMSWRSRSGGTKSPPAGSRSISSNRIGAAAA